MTFPSQGGHIPTTAGQPGLPCPLQPHPKPRFWDATSDRRGTSPGLPEAPGAPGQGLSSASQARSSGTWHCPGALWG